MENRSNKNKRIQSGTNRNKGKHNPLRPALFQNRGNKKPLSRGEKPHRTHRTTKTTEASRRQQPQSNRTSANNRQKTAALARRSRLSELNNIKLKKKSLIRIIAAVLIGAVLIGAICLIVSATKVHNEMNKNIATLEKLEAKDPGEFLAAKVPGGINVTDFAAEENKIINMDTSQIKKSDLTHRFSDTIIIGDSLSEACTAYGYLNTSIVLARIGTSVSQSSDLFEKAVNSSPIVIFLCFGSNDILAYQSNTEEFIEAYSKQIEYLQKNLPYTAIYVQGIVPPSSKVTKKGFEYRDQYNHEIETMCQDLGVYYFNSDFILKRMPSLYDVDGIHPKSDYYPRWLTYLGDIAGLEE